MNKKLSEKTEITPAIKMGEVDFPQYDYRWFCFARPNMSVEAKGNVVRVLGSGLLFKDDVRFIENHLLEMTQHSVPCLKAILPYGENAIEMLVAAVGALVCVVKFPMKSPIFSGSNMLRICGYVGVMCIPAAVRLISQTALPSLLCSMSNYNALVQIKVLSPSVNEDALLLTQLKHLFRVMCLAKKILLGTFKWLENPQQPVNWEDSVEVQPVLDGNILTKLFELLQRMQSTLLKNIAMAHFFLNLKNSYSTPDYSYNYNDKVYWMHTRLIPAVLKHFKDCSTTLENELQK